jgi:hydrogenase/urease accessory protein HupE
MFLPNGETTMRTTLAAALTLLPTAALAHPGHGVPGLLHGLSHPAGSLEHTMAMVMVGVFALMLATVAFYASGIGIGYVSRLIAKTRAT